MTNLVENSFFGSVTRLLGFQKEDNSDVDEETEQRGTMQTNFHESGFSKSIDSHLASQRSKGKLVN